MSNNMSKSQLAMKPIIHSDLSISNYNNLINRVKIIQQHYQNITRCSDKQARFIRRKLNKLKKSLNDLRKSKAKPTRKNLHQFKAEIDYLINGINKAESPFKEQLNKAWHNKLELKQYKYEQTMAKLCHARGIKPIAIPMTDVKKRINKNDRLAMMIKVADQRQKYIELQNAMVVGNKAINANGEIIAKAKHMVFIGNDEKLDELMDLAKQHGIILKQEN